MHWDPWPPRHLVLRTPRLELRPDDDAGLIELAEEALLGVHPPDLMPFTTAWTDDTPEQLADDVRLLVRRDAFRRPDWTLEVEGVEACLPMLGLTAGTRPRYEV